MDHNTNRANICCILCELGHICKVQDIRLEIYNGYDPRSQEQTQLRPAGWLSSRLGIAAQSAGDGQAHASTAGHNHNILRIRHIF
jgi:hypothetical protein